jgi:Hint domain
MVARTFFSFDNNAMLINGNPGTPIINNSDTPNGTVYTFVGGGGNEVTLNDVGGGGTRTTVFEDDQRARHTITNGNGLVANGTQVEAESLVQVRALDINGFPTGPTITLTVFSQNGVTGDVWGFASNTPLVAGTQYVKVGGNNTGSSTYTTFTACFGRGTLIRTPGGEVLVETIRAGDAVWTQRNPAARVAWVGRRVVDATADLAPVVFAPGALGNTTELVVSPNHRMCVDGWRVELLFAQDTVLVAAKHMVGLPGISRRPAPTLEYHHIMFDQHEMVEANGTLSESFFPGATTLLSIDQETYDELLRIFPKLRHDAYGATAARCVTALEARALLHA